jgi:hypothetical protein
MADRRRWGALLPDDHGHRPEALASRPGIVRPSLIRLLSTERKAGETCHRTRARSSSRPVASRKKPIVLQADLPFRPRGGKRSGAGRKPSGPRSRVSHEPRPVLASYLPVLITLRLRAGLPSTRERRPLCLLRGAFSSSEKQGFAVVHYSVQSNHLHLIVEASDRIALARGMQGFTVRAVRALNRLWRRRGQVFDDHYHARVLRTPREVRNALVYVLANARKHGHAYGEVDPFSSGRAFDGWKQAPASAGVRTVWWSGPRTWLLREGWKIHGLIDTREEPRRETKRTRGGRPP